MATKKDRPQIENPLANMALDEIVRGITITKDEPRQSNTPISEIKPKKRYKRYKINPRHLIPNT